MKLPSDGELPALRYLWRNGTATARELAATYAGRYEYASSVLNNLASKGLATRHGRIGELGSWYGVAVLPAQVMGYLQEGTWS